MSKPILKVALGKQFSPIFLKKMVEEYLADLKMIKVLRKGTNQADTLGFSDLFVEEYQKRYEQKEKEIAEARDERRLKKDPFFHYRLKGFISELVVSKEAGRKRKTLRAFISKYALGKDGSNLLRWKKGEVRHVWENGDIKSSIFYDMEWIWFLEENLVEDLMKLGD